jgi:hypothetical protein
VAARRTDDPWAKVIIVHGAAGDIAHYEFTCVLAQRHRRVLLVECESAALPAWTALATAAHARHVELVLQIPPLGGVHPLPSSAAAPH